ERSFRDKYIEKMPITRKYINNREDSTTSKNNKISPPHQEGRGIPYHSNKTPTKYQETQEKTNKITLR
ncbi:hypothetical protein C922_05630, partial [Plasmodium inui San Antonio 1]